MKIELPKNAFVPFTVLGDPNLKTSEEIIKTYIDAGADMLELGIAFSDPTADGPVIQEADQRVLNAGITTDQIFSLLKKIRKYSNIPIGLLTYANPIYKYGIAKFYKRLAEISVNAILIADLPLEEISLVSNAAKKYKIHQIFIVHDKTTQSRLKKILKYASGYLYLVSSSSTTGTRRQLPKSLKTTIKKLKKLTSLPLLVGFGVSSREQIKQVQNWGADGAIVGSKLVKIIKENLGNKAQIIRKLKTALFELIK